MSLSLRLSLFYGVVALAFTANGLTAENPFQSGIEAYEQGDYKTAKTEFTLAVNTNETPAARHNLGLALFQLDKPAQAVWQLERALILNPFNKDYRKKRNLVREQLGLTGDPTEWYDSLSQLVSISAWLMIATVSLWLLVGVFILPVLNDKSAGIRVQLLRCFSLLTLTLSLIAIGLNLQTHKTGIILSEETASLHAAPANAAPESGFARPGERAHVLDQHNNFYKIKTEGSATGWISEDDFRLLVE